MLRKVKFIILLTFCCSVLFNSCAPITTMPGNAKSSNVVMSEESTDPLNEIKSNDPEICRQGVEKILNSGDNYYKFLAVIKTSEANTPVIIETVLDNLSIHHEPFFDLCYGEGGEEAKKLALGNPRAAAAMIECYENDTDCAEYSGDYDKFSVKFKTILNSGDLIDSDKIINHLLLDIQNNYSFLLDYFKDTDNPLHIRRLLDYYLDPERKVTTFDECKMIVDSCKLSEGFLEYWPDYFSNNRYDNMDKAYSLIFDKLYPGYELITKTEKKKIIISYKSPLSFDFYYNIAKVIPALEKKDKKGLNYSFDHTAASDKDKIAVIGIYSEGSNVNPTYFFSPLSFLLIPKQNALSIDDLNNAGTIVCIHFKRIFQGRYYSSGGFTTVYSENIFLTKIDIIDGRISAPIVLKGEKPPKNIKIEMPGNFRIAPASYVYNPHTYSEIAQAVKKILNK